MKAYIRYSKEYIQSPMTPWVSTPVQNTSPTLDGYRRYYVEVGGFEFRFASLDEIEFRIETLSEKNLPASTPNTHWLSRLPGWVKTWTYRQKAVKGLKSALEQFQKRPDDPKKIQDPFAKRSAKRRRKATPLILRERIQQKKNVRKLLDSR